MDPQPLVRLASRQSGLFTRTQARACGYSYGQIRRRLDTGEWCEIRGAALAFRGTVSTAWVLDHAAALSIRGSVLAGPSAARTFDIPVPAGRTCLIVGPHGGSRLAGVQLLYEDVDPRDIGRYNGAAVTRRARTVVDCLRLLPEPAAFDLLDRALQRGWLTQDDLAARVRGLAGRRGSPRLRKMLGEATGGSRSVAERRLARLLRAAGITGWRPNTAISDAAGLIGVGDFVFDQLRLVLELDGWAFHTSPDRFQRDRSRQNRLVAAGWTILRFTWRDLTQRPEYVVRTVRTMVARLAA